MSVGWLVSLSVLGALVSVIASVSLVVVLLRAINRSGTWMQAPGRLNSQIDNLTTALHLLDATIRGMHLEPLHESCDDLHAKVDHIEKQVGKLACSRANGRDPAQEIEA